MQWQELRSHLRHLPDSDLEKVKEAFVTGEKAHEGQTRKSGEPYFIHPIAIAHLLADMGADRDSIVAALLHDTVEDTEVTLPQIRIQFGDTVANIIDGLTKLERSDLAETPTLDEQIETLRKIFRLMQEDVRIMIIKLIDRLHNMQTVSFLEPEKQRRLAQETIDVYVKIADRLSMQDIKDELELLCLSVLNTPELDMLQKQRIANEQRGRKAIAKMVKQLEENHPQTGKHIQTLHETKTWEELRKQIARAGAQVTGLSDFIVVFVCPSIDACYTVLGTLHQEWQRETLSFQDYINSPKLNGYRGLHTTVILDDGTRVRCKIRTDEMHTYARNGITSRCFTSERKGLLETLPWAQRISTVSDDTENRSQEFWENLQSDLLGDSIIVHGPHGEVMHIPKDSTALDAAFYLFEEKALRTEEVIVNGESVAFSSQLPQAAALEVKLDKEATVKLSWLDWVSTGLATALIRSSLGGQSDRVLINTGKHLFEQFLQKKNRGYLEEIDQNKIAAMLRELGYPSMNAVLIEIADGHVDMNVVYEHLFERKKGSVDGDLVSVHYSYPADAQKVYDRLADIFRQYQATCTLMQVRTSTDRKTMSVNFRCRLSEDQQLRIVFELESAGASDVEIRRHGFWLPLPVGFGLITLLWGLDPVAAQWLLTARDIAAIDLTFIRFIAFFIVATLVFSIQSAVMLQNFRPPSLRNGTLLLSGAALFATAYCTYLGLQSLTPSQYILLILLGTFVPTEILSFANGRRPLIPVLRICALSALLTLTIIAEGMDKRGLILGILSSAGFAVYSLLTSRYQRKSKVRARYAAFVFFLSVVTLPFALALTPFVTVNSMDPMNLLLAVGFVVVFNVLPYGFYYAFSNRGSVPTYLLLFTAVPTLLVETLVTGKPLLLFSGVSLLAFALWQMQIERKRTMRVAS